MLLPSFFAYAFGGPTRLLARTGVFFLGVAAVLVPLGAGSGAMAAQLTTHREALIQAAGGIIIALGVVAILGGGWSAGPATRIQQQMAQRGTGCPPPVWARPTGWPDSAPDPSWEPS